MTGSISQSNWQKERLRITRRNKLITALLASIKIVPIYEPGGGCSKTGDLDKPTYTRAVTVEEVEAAATRVEGERNAKRLHPIKEEKAD
jgi:hypothetical protein